MGINVFSDVIEAEDKEDLEWLMKAANRLWGPSGEENWPDVATELLAVDHSEIVGMLPKYKIVKKRRASGLIVYSTDGASLHAVTPLVQLYLRKFHRDWWWAIEWAEISETPQPGGFGGGAVFVTADHVAWHFTAHFLGNMIENFEHQYR